MPATIVGLDIGNRTVRAVELKNPGSAKPQLLRHASVALPEGAVHRGEVLEVATVSSAIKQLWSAGGFKTKNVVLGMGGARVLARELSVPKAPLAQIKESLPFHVQELLPVPVSDALLDFYPISEEDGEQGAVVKGLLVAAIKDAVTANVEAAMHAGLQPKGIDFVPFAVSRALAPVQQAKGRMALVDVGFSSTNVVIVVDGVPQFVRIVPGGGEDITSAFVNDLQLDPVTAEAKKRELGLTRAASAEDQVYAEVLFRAAGELLGSIRNTLNYYAATRPQAPLERIVLTGGGSRLRAFDVALAQASGIPVERSTALARVSLPKTRATDGAYDDVDVALGLALGAKR
jgi:type IV pilus assembly protein PilM